MKTVICVLVLFFGIQSMDAVPAGLESVTTLVEGFIRAKQPECKLLRLSPRPVGESTEQALYFVAELDPTGFVIVANDLAAVPVIGFSFAHDLGAWDLPENLRWFFATVEEQLLALRNSSLASHHEWQAALSGDFSRYQSTRSVTPLIQTNWNQNYPYNAACPSDGSGRAYAGCVATAMAQIMKYWSYPLSGSGSYSYDSSYGVLSADFASSTFDWSAMPNSISSENPQIANLLYQCGIACHMNYSASGSYATGTNTIHAVIANFGYSANAQSLYKDHFPLTTWNDMLQTELENGHPIGYSGGTGLSAHAFVLDGVQATNYYHVNWGWGGYLNGYFYLDNLVPQASYNYTSNQAGIFNLVPEINPPSSPSAELSGATAGISWYAPETTNQEAKWLKWGGGREYQNFGFSSAANYEIAIRFPVSALEGFSGRRLEKVRFIAGMAGANYTLKIYGGGSASSPGTLIHSQAIPSFHTGAWNMVTLSSPVSISGSQEIWIGIQVSQPSAGYPVSIDYGPLAPNTGNLIKIGSNAWTPLNALEPSLVCNWLIIGVLDDPIPDSTPRSLTGYRVWRLTPDQMDTPSSWSLLTPASTSLTTFSDNQWDSLAFGEYLWAITAIHTQGMESLPAFTNHLAKLEAPQLLQISRNQINGRISLSWQVVSGADSYDIYEATSPTSEFILIGSSDTNNWWHFPAPGDRCLFYRVIAVGE